MATIDYISDWAARLRSRLYTQFRGKATWESWVQLIARQAQDLEDASQTLFSMLDIDVSDGVQLDVIGRLVGQPRLGADDVLYRLYLKARVASNASTGTTEDLYRVFRVIFGTTIGFIVATGLDSKTFVFRVKGVITGYQSTVARIFLQIAKEAGARGIFAWQQIEDADAFCFDGGSGKGFGVASDTAVGGQFTSAFQV